MKAALIAFGTIFSEAWREEDGPSHQAAAATPGDLQTIEHS